MLDEPCAVYDPDGEMWDEGTFRNVVLKELGGKELAFELVTSGFIKKDFSLYIAKYPKGARARAINFLFHCYKRGSQDINMWLKESDCREILKTIPSSHFSRKSVLNRCLFRYVLGENEEKEVHCQALPMVKGCIADFKESGRVLFDDVLLSNVTSEVKMELITLATPYFDGIFDYLADSISSENGWLVDVTLIEQAFSCMGSHPIYTCQSFAPWIKNHLVDIDFKSIDKDYDGWALRVAGLLKTAGVVIDDLSKFGLHLKTACAECGIIEINRSNLQSMLQIESRDAVPPLNKIIIEERVVWKAIAREAKNMRGYLGSLSEGEWSLSALDDEVERELFSWILAWESPKEAESVIGLIVSRANQALVISDVTQLLAISDETDVNDLLDCFLCELVAHDMVQQNLKNAVILARMAFGHADFYVRARFEDFALVYLEKGDTLDLGSDLPDIRLFILLILRHLGTDASKAKELIGRLKKENEDAFPININDLWMEDVKCSPELLTDLYEADMFAPAWKVYRLVHDAPWRFRERILLKWDKTDTSVRLFGPIRSMLVYDLLDVISSYCLRGTQLWEDVRRNWKDYLETSDLDDESIKRLSRDIERQIELAVKSERKEQQDE